jgi:hypothetical protein
MAQVAKTLGADLGDLEAIPEAVERVLAGPGAAVGPPARLIEFTGAGPNQWTAAEGALKVRETCWVATEGLSVEQLLHGPAVALASDASSALDGAVRAEQVGGKSSPPQHEPGFTVDRARCHLSVFRSPCTADRARLPRPSAEPGDFQRLLPPGARSGSPTGWGGWRAPRSSVHRRGYRSASRSPSPGRRSRGRGSGVAPVVAGPPPCQSLPAPPDSVLVATENRVGRRTTHAVVAGVAAHRSAILFDICRWLTTLIWSSAPPLRGHLAAALDGIAAPPLSEFGPASPGGAGERAVRVLKRGQGVVPSPDAPVAGSGPPTPPAPAPG